MVPQSLPRRCPICCLFLSSASTVTFPSFLCVFACGCTLCLACFPPSGSCTPAFDDFTAAASEGSGRESFFFGSSACKQFALRIPGHRGVRKNDWLYMLVFNQLRNCKLFLKNWEVSSKKKQLHSHPSCEKVHALARCIKAANWFISTFVVYCWAINTLTKELLTSSAECTESLLSSIRFLSFWLLSVPRTIRQKG